MKLYLFTFLIMTSCTSDKVVTDRAGHPLVKVECEDASCSEFTKSCGGSAHGSVITGYLQPTSPHGVPCITAVKTCMNGLWSGPEVYPSCVELPQ